MGMMQYHRQFIKGFSDIATPIFATLKKGSTFIWTKAVEEALDTIIEKIGEDPHIAHPNPKKPFELEIDASSYATGVVLIQQGDNNKRIEVGYHSKALNETE